MKRFPKNQNGFTRQNFYQKVSGGFTIIEVMIAMAIFTVIITIGIGAVLDTTTQHYRNKNIRTVMDSLDYVIEDIGRNLRLASNVRCITSANASENPIDSSGDIIPASCPDASYAYGSNRIFFRSLTGTHVGYIISVPTAGGTSQVLKQIGDDPLAAVPVTPPELEIDFNRSGFRVSGAEPNDMRQPVVTIRLAGKITYKGVDSNFEVETSVALRALDS